MVLDLRYINTIQKHMSPTLRKIYQNMGLLWLTFSRVRTEFTIFDIRECTGQRKPTWYILRCGRQVKLRAWGYSVLYKKLSLYNDLHGISLSYNSTEKNEFQKYFVYFTDFQAVNHEKFWNLSRGRGYCNA